MPLIVVSGAPGTGKSTIAAALGAALRFPVLSLDPIKEALADVLGLGGEDWSDQVGDAAAEVVFRLAAAFPDAVAEGWWRGPRRARALDEFAGATEVFCHCDPRLASDRAMAVLPFHYSFGASVLQTHLAVGGTVVIDKRFLFPDKVLQRMIETRCTGFAGVPSHYQILLRKSRFKDMDFPDLRWLQQAGGKLQPPFVRELRETKPSLRLYLMYGATEATARLSILDPGQVAARPGSIGRGIPGVTLRVLDEQGRPVAPGDTGEIVAEGENIASGYFQDPAETATTFRNGRLHTGDLATVDGDGYVTVLGRAKSFLKCGGTRTSAERFEEALLAFPDIVEAAVIGIPDEVMGEAPAAFVVARDPSDLTLAARLREFAEAKLPLALRPKIVEVVPELPKSAAGKVQRIKLHDRLRARQDAA